MEFAGGVLGHIVDEESSNSVLSLVMAATGSGGIGSNTTIEKLWSALPEPGRDFVRRSDASLAPWSLSQPSERSAEMHVNVPDRSLLKDSFSSTFAAMTTARSQLAKFDISQGRANNWYTDTDSGGFIVYFPAVNISKAHDVFLRDGMYYDTRSARLYACLDGNRPIHPIVAWLAILYALSIMARYHPEKWSRALDIDKSGDAPMLEDILGRADVVCSGLILNTIDHMGVLHRLGVRPAAARTPGLNVGP